MPAGAAWRGAAEEVEQGREGDGAGAGTRVADVAARPAALKKVVYSDARLARLAAQRGGAGGIPWWAIAAGALAALVVGGGWLALQGGWATNAGNRAEDSNRVSAEEPLTEAPVFSRRGTETSGRAVELPKAPAVAPSEGDAAAFEGLTAENFEAAIATVRDRKWALETPDEQAALGRFVQGVTFAAGLRLGKGMESVKPADERRRIEALAEEAQDAIEITELALRRQGPVINELQLRDAAGNAVAAMAIGVRVGKANDKGTWVFAHPRVRRPFLVRLAEGVEEPGAGELLVLFGVYRPEAGGAVAGADAGGDEAKNGAEDESPRPAVLEVWQWVSMKKP
jgi:hypothetical protein